MPETKERIAGLLREGYPVAKGLLATLLLEEDAEIRQLVGGRETPETLAAIDRMVREQKERETEPIEYRMAIRHRKEAARVASGALNVTGRPGAAVQALDRVLMHPFWGFVFLAGVLYLGLYQFVGVFGAGIVVDFMEETVFGAWIEPPLTALVRAAMPGQALQNLFVGPYGVVTLGLRYAVALILPMVASFFLVFSVIEDSGYLPRLAMLLDRTFKRLGLSGRAVIPMVLGFGCATMATLVTRTLPTRRERTIATLLLSLAVPCSAQLGVILALLSRHPKALALWALIIIAVFLAVGSMVSRMLPGQQPSFYMELPPLRWPDLANIWQKTASRVTWYFVEILPLFLMVSVIIWAGQLTGLFGWLIGKLEVPVRAIGLPAQASAAFFFGFFRRDYGAAGLYDLARQGLLDTRQLAVASIALTLFLPCVAQFLVNLKERGWRTGLGISAFILAVSFSVAYLVNAAIVSLRLPL